MNSRFGMFEAVAPVPYWAALAASDTNLTLRAAVAFDDLSTISSGAKLDVRSTPAGSKPGTALISHHFDIEGSNNSLEATNEKRPARGPFYVWRRGRD
jgi:hypothetical protein